MSKFNKLYNRLMQEDRDEHLPLASVMKVFDDTVRSLGLQSNLNKMADTYLDADGNLNADKMELLKAATLKSFETSRIHSQYRDDLESQGYELLVQIADMGNLWSQGQNTGLQSI